MRTDEEEGELGGRGTETSHGGWVGPGPSEAGASPERLLLSSRGRFSRKVVTGVQLPGIQGVMWESRRFLFQDASRKGEAETQGGGLRGRQTPNGKFFFFFKTGVGWGRDSGRCLLRKKKDWVETDTLKP